MDTVAWPQKTGELVRWIADSRPWNDFRFRPDDIVIATWAKTGTTWTQEIVNQLISLGTAEELGVTRSPWPDAPMWTDALERAEAQTHRRFLKTHLPIENLVYSPRAKYIYVGRDGRDAFWSWHNHHMSFTDGFFVAGQFGVLFPLNGLKYLEVDGVTEPGAGTGGIRRALTMRLVMGIEF